MLEQGPSVRRLVVQFVYKRLQHLQRAWKAVIRHQMHDRGRQMPDPEKHHQGTCGNRSKLTFVMQLFLL